MNLTDIGFFCSDDILWKTTKHTGWFGFKVTSTISGLLSTCQWTDWLMLLPLDSCFKQTKPQKKNEMINCGLLGINNNYYSREYNWCQWPIAVTLICLLKQKAELFTFSIKSDLFSNQNYFESHTNVTFNIDNFFKNRIESYKKGIKKTLIEAEVNRKTQFHRQWHLLHQ